MNKSIKIEQYICVYYHRAFVEEMKFIHSVYNSN